MSNYNSYIGEDAPEHPSYTEKEAKPPLKFKFKTIDDWNRPVFKAVGSSTLIGSTDVLFPDRNIAPNNSPEEITKYFQENKGLLTYFGTRIDDDPMGTAINPDKFEIIDYK